MPKCPRADRALALFTLACAAAACARAPVALRQPSWTGHPPAGGSPSYTETLDALQLIFEEYPPHGLPQRLSAPAPCVLRVVSSDDFSGYPRATAANVHLSTWVDLGHVTELHATSAGKDAGPGSPTGTCVSFGGPRGFAVQTQIMTRARGRTARHIELADERSPHVCIGNRAHPEKLAAPLRQLVSLCGGRAAR
jgi:hypothetical protein